MTKMDNEERLLAGIVIAVAAILIGAFAALGWIWYDEAGSIVQMGVHVVWLTVLIAGIVVGVWLLGVIADVLLTAASSAADWLNRGD